MFGNYGTLTLNGYSGTICGWQSSPTGQPGSWTSVAGTAGQTALVFADLKQTTYFQALVTTDPNCSLCTAASASAVVNIDQLASGGTISGLHYVCVGKSITLTYYRLRQTDFDGTETLSKVVAVVASDVGGAGKLKVYPSPTTSIVLVESPATGVFSVLDVAGRTVLSGTISPQISVAGLPAGIYILKTETGAAKFVKQ